MKNIIKINTRTKLSYSLLVLLLSFSLSSIGYAQSTSEKLIGSWTFNYDDSFKKMKNEAKTHYDKMDTTRKERLENIYKGRVITFNNDGSYTQQLPNGRKMEGKWELNPKNTQIIITNSSGKELRQNIKTLTVTQLILKPEDIGRGKMLLSEWYFTKN